MVLCTRPDQSFTYITEADRSLPRERQTVWHLRLLSRSQRAWCAARQGKGQWEIADEVCRAGILGIDNLMDPTGQVVPYAEERADLPVCGEIPRGSVIARELLEMIPPLVRVEIMAAILNGSVALEHEVGN